MATSCPTVAATCSMFWRARSDCGTGLCGRDCAHKLKGLNAKLSTMHKHAPRPLRQRATVPGNPTERIMLNESSGVGELRTDYSPARLLLFLIDLNTCDSMDKKEVGQILTKGPGE